MIENDKLSRWILKNKQVGVVFSYDRDGELTWSSVAIQKHGNVIKVYVDEILDSEMNSENYLREEVVNFNNIRDAISYVSSDTMASIDNLAPCKGQKIFNPTNL